jgi:hypothetical protein
VLSAKGSRKKRKKEEGKKVQRSLTVFNMSTHMQKIEALVAMQNVTRVQW